jgi:hypothetical protein
MTCDVQHIVGASQYGDVTVGILYRDIAARIATLDLLPHTLVTRRIVPDGSHHVRERAFDTSRPPTFGAVEFPSASTTSASTPGKHTPALPAFVASVGGVAMAGAPVPFATNYQSRSPNARRPPDASAPIATPQG